MRPIVLTIVVIFLSLGIVSIVTPVCGLPVPGYYESPIGIVNISATIPDSPPMVTAYRVILGPNDMEYYSSSNLEEIRSSVPSEEDAPLVAQNILNNYGGLPPDAVLTESTIEYLIQMNGTTNQEMARYPISTNVQYGRKINDVPVVGDGAYINMELGDNGELLYLNKAWRTVAPDGSLSIQPVSAAIDKLRNGDVLNPKKDFHDVNITKIRLGYFEKGLNQSEEFLEPAWLFRGTTESGDPIQYYVYARKLTNFTAFPTNASTFQPIQFTDFSETALVKWYWDFGDGTNSTERNPKHVYRTMGNFTVSLTAWNDMGSDTEKRTDLIFIDTYQKPINADFNATLRKASTGDIIQFYDNSDLSPDKWYWEFGDGTNSTEQNPTHAFQTGGNFTINLTAWNSNGSDTLSIENYILIYPYPKPVANFTTNYSFGNTIVPLAVEFNDTSSGNITQWFWDFGDGSNSTERSPVHTYNVTPGELFGYNTANLSVTDDVGRTSSHATYIDVKKALYPDFKGEPVTGYSPLNVTFTDLTTDSGLAAGNHWDFGDGLSSDAWGQPLPSTFSHEYTSPGTYSVTLRYSVPVLVMRSMTSSLREIHPNAISQYDVYSKTKDFYILVRLPQPPTADFSANVTSGKTPLAVGFQDNSSGLPTQWTWSFGDGTGSQDQNPIHTYTTAGSYSVSLNASNVNGGNSSTKIDYVMVFPLSPPVASFSANPLSGKVPLTVVFNDTSTGTPSNRSWDFGDGITSTDRAPVHTYTNSGTYTVSLNVTNEDGSNASIIPDYILVSPLDPPVAAFSMNTTSGETPLVVAFTDNSSGSPTNWNWTFGDGSISTEQNPVHVYTASGQFTVSLEVSNPDGSNTTTKEQSVSCSMPVLPVADFSANQTSGRQPLAVGFTDQSTGSPVSWHWTFGDGVAATEQNPVHVYMASGTYTVTLESTNHDGSDTRIKADYITVSATPLPVANFTAKPACGKAPLTVTFTDLSTGSPDRWNWNFGDNTTSTQQNPVHIYSKPGKYSISLTVANAGGTNTMTRSGFVTVGSISPPEADFIGKPTCGKVPLTIKFNDTSKGNPTNWLWNFGDGSNSTVQNPVHIYVKSGKFTVSLRVTNAGGDDTKTARDYIIVNPVSPPDANFVGKPTIGKLPLSVEFNDTSTGNPTSWLWNFGDGTTSTIQHPFHVYSVAGKYTVSLKVTNIAGDDTKTVHDYITVRSVSPPDASFIGQPVQGNPPLNVIFRDTSSGSPTNWRWDFGDGSNSTIQNPVHTYPAPGKFTVSLVASNAGGSDTATRFNYISVTSVVPTNSVTPTHTCTPGHSYTAPKMEARLENGKIRLDWDSSVDQDRREYKVVISKHVPLPTDSDEDQISWTMDRDTNFSIVDTLAHYHHGNFDDTLKPGETYYFRVGAVYPDQVVFGNVVELSCPGSVQPSDVVLNTTPSFTPSLNVTLIPTISGNTTFIEQNSTI
jgi:PKD repeat protein